MMFLHKLLSFFLMYLISFWDTRLQLLVVFMTIYYFFLLCGNCLSIWLGSFPLFYYIHVGLHNDVLLLLVAKCDEFSCAFTSSFVESGSGPGKLSQPHGYCQALKNVASFWSHLWVPFSWIVEPSVSFIPSEPVLLLGSIPKGLSQDPVLFIRKGFSWEFWELWWRWFKSPPFCPIFHLPVSSLGFLELFHVSTLQVRVVFPDPTQSAIPLSGCEPGYAALGFPAHCIRSPLPLS